MDGVGASDWRGFEKRAENYLSELWATEVRPRTVMVGDAVPKLFDLVSADRRYVGDAKWMKNIPTPAAKWSTIAEYVWLLQKTRAETAFLVFGNDPTVAERFLARRRPLVAPVQFFFLDERGHRVL